MMPALAYLLLAHLIADFPLQTNWIYWWKVRSVAGLAIHAATHMLVTALILSDPLKHWLMLALLGLAHFTIDWLKLRRKGPALAGFLLDQGFHIISLILIAMIFPIQSTIPVKWLYPTLAYATLPAALVALWIFAVNQQPASRANCWMRRRLLNISQIVGLPLVVILPVRLLGW